jgi:hypothetical protein
MKTYIFFQTTVRDGEHEYTRDRAAMMEGIASHDQIEAALKEYLREWFNDDADAEYDEEEKCVWDCDQTRLIKLESWKRIEAAEYAVLSKFLLVDELQVK